MAETLISNCTRGIPSNFSRLRPISATRRQLPSFVGYSPEFCDLKGRFDYPIGSFRARKWVTRAAATSSSMVEDANDESMSVDNLRRFMDLNVGKWNGSFYQFDGHGNLLQTVSTKLSASSYGEDELISLIQT
ncbi:hypothetical protein B296_00016029 [Ensete ventricosum]|uniref:DUF3598 domain-containing protein n=1 Tax=Ensete ventricosum TaxID=4639 RepID=A0A426YI48_ENSVE|nr:hypothetical protein B296_00016029 [Ensete ventricosum]